MALRFDGSTQFLSNSNAVIVTFPFTMAVRFFTDTLAVNQNLLGIYQGGTPNAHYLSIQTPGALVGRAQSVGGGGSFAGANTVNTVAVSTWQTLVGRYANASSREAILNADFANAGSNGSTRDPVGLDTTAFGQYQGTFVDEFDGMACDLAFWSVLLTDDEITSYNKGFSPLLIRPGTLVHHWPIIGKKSPEPDLISGFDFTLNNAPVAAEHPRIYLPKKKKIYSNVPGTAVYNIALSTTFSRAVGLQRQGNIRAVVQAPRAAALSRVGQLVVAAKRVVGNILLTVQLPSIVHIALTVTVSRTVTLSHSTAAAVRKFVGSAGLGVFIRSASRWSRRRRR